MRARCYAPSSSGQSRVSASSPPRADDMTNNKDIQSAPVPGTASPYPATALTIIDPRWTLFVRVVAAGSLSKAAVLLDMPQSMVSRNIALLESQCGERLFHRTGRGVVLT